MNAIALSNKLSQTAKELTGLIQSLTQEQIDTVPFEGSWTAGQVAEHILKSASSLTSVLNGNTETTGRQPDEKVAVIESIFLDFSKKLQSPDFIIPTHSTHPKEALLDEIRDTFNAITRAADTLDLSLLCLSFELPNMGKLTRYEWCIFVLTHTQRHVHQLKNIAEVIG